MKAPGSNAFALLLAALTLSTLPTAVSAADAVFSGPQPGEAATAFQVLSLRGPDEGKERSPLTQNPAKPKAVVFIHALERSLVPLLRIIDQYGSERTNHLDTEFVFLAADRLQGEQRGRAASNSLRLQGQVGLSLDGAEGPGNYGLNKDCMMTVLAVKNGKTLANFALTQPGITDAPKVIEALAKASDDPNPPTVEQLDARSMARGGPPGMNRRMQANRDASSPNANTDPAAAPNKPKDPFPGAVPTDPRLNSLVRQLIRPTHDDATVNKLWADFEQHLKDHPDLTQQAVDGWLRVLHFGERYGTPRSRELARKYLEQSKTTPPAAKPATP